MTNLIQEAARLYLAEELDPMRQAWASGDLTHVLRYEPHIAVRDAVYATPPLGRFVGLIGRQFGKSRTAVTLVNEVAQRHPGLPIRYAAQTQGEVLDIIEPHMRDILETCPKDMRPVYKSQRGHWEWPNGSTLHVAGCDTLKNAERLRGPKASLIVIDEAGFIDELEYIVRSILSPQLLTTRGRMVMISTPSKSGEHPFMKDFVVKARESGNFLTFTIDDAPHLTAQDREDFIAQVYGSKETPAAQRELYCINVPDPTRAVIPEFATAKRDIVMPWTRPKRYRPYVGADFGFNDLTAVVFGYCDWEAQLFVVEDELILENETTPVIANLIRKKEGELWEIASEDDAQRMKLVRIGDAPSQQVADMAKHYKIHFGKPKKLFTGADERDTHVAELRKFVQDRRLRIHPRCQGLIAHLEHGIWNKSRTSFERSGDFGHFDAIDALRYVLRAVDFNHNPYPNPTMADLTPDQMLGIRVFATGSKHDTMLAKTFRPAATRRFQPKR